MNIDKLVVWAAFNVLSISLHTLLPSRSHSYPPLHTLSFHLTFDFIDSTSFPNILHLLNHTHLSLFFPFLISTPRSSNYITTSLPIAIDHHLCHSPFFSPTLRVTTLLNIMISNLLIELFPFIWKKILIQLYFYSTFDLFKHFLF